MGTHPIFESDFDCLTEIMTKGKKKKPKDNSPRCVFCGQLGLEDANIPLTDEEIERRQEILLENDNSEEALPDELKRPLAYEFEFEYKYGEWIKDHKLDADQTKSSHNKDLSCHERCLISSPQLYANTDDPDKENFIPADDVTFTLGKRGFDRESILKEVNRGRRLICFVCKKHGAHVGCGIKSCQKKFHYPCAVEHDMCAIVDNRTNPVLCAKHATREHRKIISRGQCKYTIDVDFKIIKAKAIVMVENERNNHEYNILFCVQNGLVNPEDNEPYTCKVCFLEFEKEDVSKMVFGKCCLNSYFHRECAARMSMNQGIHQTRCPACRDKEVYIKSIVAQGAPCPNRDNLVERIGCFDDQLAAHRTKVCNNSSDKANPRANCKYPEKDSENGTKYEVMLCDECGGNGSHVACDAGLMAMWEEEQCTGVKRQAEDWHFKCITCRGIDNEADTPPEVGSQDSTLASTMDEVVCLVDEKENDVKSSLKRKLASPAQNAAKKAKQGDITNFFRKK